MSGILPWCKIIAPIILPFSLVFSNVFASEAGHYTVKSFRGSEPGATFLELNLINSEIKNILHFDIYSNFTEKGDRIYVYGKTYIPCKNNKKIFLLSRCEFSIRSVIVVQFQIMHGVNYNQYLVILDRSNEKIYGPFKIGGMGYRNIQVYGIANNNNIAACALVYRANDSMTHPSVNALTGFELGNFGLHENNSVINSDYYDQMSRERCDLIKNFSVNKSLI